MVKIDYEKKYEEAKDGNFPAYKSGLYVCEIIEAEDRPDNVYNGEAAPQTVFHLSPLNLVTAPDAPMMGTDGNERPAKYRDADGNEKVRYFFYNIGVDEDGSPKSVHEKSNFGKLLKALFDDEMPPKEFENFPDAFIGQKVICQIAAIKKESGGMSNKITALSNFADNTAPKKKLTSKEADEAAAVLDGVGQDGTKPEDLPFS